jgi:hypothetical protein
MRKFFLQSWFHILLLVAAASLLILPAMLKGIPKSGDLNHHFRVGVSLYESVRQGEFSPGWNSLSTGGYGDVSFRFYPPAFYYLMTLARFLTGNWHTASLLIFVLLSVVGGLGLYYWAQIFLRPELALGAGFFFLVSPYHVNELYQSSLLPEYAACAVLPFCFAFIELLCRTAKGGYVIGLGAAYAMLILTHLPLTVIGSMALAIYALLRLRKTSAWKSLARLSAAVLLGLAASAFYWVTMVAELGWMRGNKVQPDVWYDYRYNFLFGKALDGSTTWWATALAFATLLTTLPAFVLYKKLHQAAATTNQPEAATGAGAENSSRLVAEQNTDAPFKAISLVTIISFFMMVPLSRPVWAVVPFLKEVQFPWRWLTVASMVCAILCAASLPPLWSLAKGKGRPLALLAAGCFLIPLGLTMLQIIRNANYLPRPAFDSFVQTIAPTPSLADWLPLWASPQPKAMAEPVEAPNREFSVTSWQAEHRNFQIAAGNQTEARVRTFYYPHWLATADGKRLETRPDADGALLISLPDTAASVELDFCEPRRAIYANGLSLLAWAFIGASSILLLRRRKLRPGPEEAANRSLAINAL